MSVFSSFPTPILFYLGCGEFVVLVTVRIYVLNIERKVLGVFGLFLSLSAQTTC